MIPKKPSILLLYFAALSVSGIAKAQDTNSLVEKLSGGLEKEKAAKQTSQFKTRGFTTRGISTTTAPAVKKETRSVIFTTRGISSARSRGVATAISATDSSAPAQIKQVTAPAENPYGGAGDLPTAPGEQAYEMTYAVDAESQLKGEIKFPKGKTRIVDHDSVRFLIKVAEALKHPTLQDQKFVIEGHASAEGSAEANQNLSQARANSIYDLLVSKSYGVDPGRLLPVGFGETKARFPATSPESALAEDRRVLFFRLVD
ncbi:MAG: OmpA family protein [Verrucomicrobiales bacterium]|nr:OmpA family protein [Verrucomicrobiales bacterium]